MTHSAQSISEPSGIAPQSLDPSPPDYPAIGIVIDGHWENVGSRRTAPVVNPSTGKVLGDLPFSESGDLARALDAAARSFEAWGGTPAVERSGVLRRTADIVRSRSETLAGLISLELGKPFPEAIREVETAAGMFEWAAEEGRRSYGRVIPSRTAGMVMTSTVEPVGPVAAFCGWNAPAITPARKISGAVAAGCSIVIKPSESTPASALFLVRCLETAGLPRGVVNVVFGDAATIAEALWTSPITRMVTFTGSIPVGRQLAALAGLHLKRMVFELGGHAPVLIFPDVDVKAVATAAVAAKFRNSGQVCTAPTRFVVHRDCYETFTERFVEVARAWRVGDPFLSTTQMGPLQNARRVSATADLIADAVGNGASLLTGGRPLDRPGFFFEPTVLTDVSFECRVAHEEPFGPIALISSFASEEDAIAEANRLPVGLTSYLFSHDLRVVEGLSAAIHSGAVIVNNWAASYPETPFGGMGDSGIGTEGGVEGLQAFQQVKFVSRRA
jgi:succinate-semialdehyde dehydrogenase/glutarate-semialdehyde dehydrogenase